ncbi:putative phosphoribosyl transferase domain protein [Rosellinia necatrix]|uniref:Putative phosphoribosyl transferase domain protein n=1 Tax=Rosellinia necatrix TaxID=77044 RepID=A0A1W2TWL1_ROSNE|nr:putative phosphoribosyl transferase domain protein [Rosellinia necatrix]
MATLEALKHALRQKADAPWPHPLQRLSDKQYSAGFDTLTRDLGWTTYRDFIIPELSRLIAGLLESRAHISVLEIGPGPKSVLGHLPEYMRRRVGRYIAFEPNALFAASLEEWINPHSSSSSSGAEAPPIFPCLETQPDIRRAPFTADGDDEDDSLRETNSRNLDDNDDDEDDDENNGKFDLVLFCHSMYGMTPQHKFIAKAFTALASRPAGALVVVFHRDGALDLSGLACHRTASFPTGAVRIANNHNDDGGDATIDIFASFIAGSVAPDASVSEARRRVCRDLGRRTTTAADGHLTFAAPECMVAFTRAAAAAADELAALVPSVPGPALVKNRDARGRRPALVVRPAEIRHVQECVRWALRHGVGLTVVGGGHGGQCVWSAVVAVDMGAFDQVHVVRDGGSAPGPLVVAEAGCRTGDIVRVSMAAGLTVPLGSRPSVGAGLWLQGGIGHLARLHGLACDAIVGAVVVDVLSGRLLAVGHVPAQHVPADATRLDGEADADLLWALKGAGTNFGIVVSVVFKAWPAPTYAVRNWVFSLADGQEAHRRLADFDTLVAAKIPRDCSADAYLYWNAGCLHLGITLFESTGASPGPGIAGPSPAYTLASAVLGPSGDVQTVDGIGLFETEMYMSGMHGGHGGGKTSAFKRCVFLADIGDAQIAEALAAAIRARPSPLCYLHLLQGGGAVADVAPDATAFGRRDWAFACVVTGVWPRGRDGTEDARAAAQWVYDVAGDLLRLPEGHRGVYGADLGPDPRDAALAATAFRPNGARLARLKHEFDPHGVLSYACPLPPSPHHHRRRGNGPELVILVTGESCAGKDYCAGVWAARLAATRGCVARAACISDATKRAYAAASLSPSGVDLDRLHSDRAYKERHRPALTAFFARQARRRPRVREENFFQVVREAGDVDVLFVTGAREAAPVATLARLVPDRRVLEVRVEVGAEVRRARGGCGGGNDEESNGGGDDGETPEVLPYRPDFVFNNDAPGSEAAEKFADDRLLPLVHDDLRRLAALVAPVPDFPRPHINFQHVLGIAQRPGGLALCTSLLRRAYADRGDWADVGAVVCCEAGGFIYAAALAVGVGAPLALIRDAGKLPPPVVAGAKHAPSHISSAAITTTTTAGGGDRSKTMIEMGRDAVPARGVPAVLVDDVLASGETLCAALRLLRGAGVDPADVAVLVVMEFPVHGGRALLRDRGFGAVRIRSLLVCGDA